MPFPAVDAYVGPIGFLNQEAVILILAQVGFFLALAMVFALVQRPRLASKTSGRDISAFPIEGKPTATHDKYVAGQYWCPGEDSNFHALAGTST